MEEKVLTEEQKAFITKLIEPVLDILADKIAERLDGTYSKTKNFLTRSDVIHLCTEVHHVLSARTLNAIDRNMPSKRPILFYDLIRHSVEELRSFRGLGSRAIYEIQGVASSVGLQVGFDYRPYLKEYGIKVEDTL